MKINNSQKVYINRLISFIILVSLLLSSIGLAAQVLEEITVTAQKREESIQDVGIAITAFSGELITALGYENAEEISRMTPGLHYVPLNGGQESQFTIRGVIQSDFNDFIESPNAVYIDEGYVSNTQGQRFGLFDLERVEVLKGPQGTLFGRNATGGLVHFITRRPTRESEGYFDAQYGSFDQIRVEGAFGGPLSDSLSFRFSGMYNKHDGIQDNLYPALTPIDPFDGAPFVGSNSGAADDIGSEDAWAIRGQLLWELNDDVEFHVRGFASGSQPSTTPFQQIGTTAVLDPVTMQHVDTVFASNDPLACEILSSAGGCLAGGTVNDGDFDDTRPAIGGDLFGFFDPGGFDNLDTSSDHAPDDFTDYESHGFTGTLAWNLGENVLTSVTHYMHFEKQQTLDGDSSPVPLTHVNNNNNTDTFTQEIRLNGELDRTKWVAGFYYLHINNDNKFGFDQPSDSPLTQLFTVASTSFEQDVFVHLITDSYSFFGQVDYDLTDQLTLILGGRIIIEEKEFNFTQPFYLSTNDAAIDDDQAPISSIDLFGFGPLEYPDFKGDSSDTLWAGRIGLEYQANEDLLWYAGVNRGVKAGSFNGKPQDFTPPLAPEDIPYKEEILLAYELGFKSTLFNGSTSLNASLYYYDYKDYQAFVFVGAGGFVQNVDAEYVGVEVEIFSKPTDNLDLMFNISWIDAEIKNLGVADGVFRDVKPALIPEWQLAGLARYTFPNAILAGDVALQIDFNYLNDRPSNVRNFTAHVLEGYTLANARLSWTSSDQSWVATLFVNNFTDTRYNTNSFDLSTLGGHTQEPPGKPRWFGGKIRYNWE